MQYIPIVKKEAFHEIETSLDMACGNYFPWLYCLGYFAPNPISRGGHAGYKRIFVFHDNGWEWQWIKSTALQPGWKTTCKVSCSVPAEVITDVFPDLSAPLDRMREKLHASRADIGEMQNYTVEIDLDKFSTKRGRGMYPVSLPSNKQMPGPHVRCTMVLTGRESRIRVPEFEGLDIVYVPKKVLKLAIEERLHK